MPIAIFNGLAIFVSIVYSKKTATSASYVISFYIDERPGSIRRMSILVSKPNTQGGSDDRPT